MDRPNRQTVRHAAAEAAVILVAALCRNIGREIPGRSLSLLRSLLYIGLFTAWGISVQRRVMQPQARRILMLIAALMVFWVFDRTVKFFFVTDQNVIRYLWYLYYLPMLLIPLLSVFAAVSLGKPESFRLPHWSRLLYIPAGVLFLLVLTNDLHQIAFVFPADAAVWSDGDASHGPGSFAVLACMIACALTAVGMISPNAAAPEAEKLCGCRFC